MKNKLLVICGPTATGKTSLGIDIAKKFNGEIVSADSRQVYRYMDIGTGKGLLVNSKFEILNSKFNGVYKIDGVSVWGYDLVGPKERYSVSEYFKIAKEIISDIWKRNKLPIIVGGTGLYIKSLIDGIPTVDIPRNENLRKSLETLSVDEMFDKLAVLDSSKAGQMNSSDKRNSRRLTRAIEIAVWNIENETKKQIVEHRKNVLDKDVDVLMIGLSAEQEILFKNIQKRVERRMNEGFIDEVEELLKRGVSWKNQSMNSLGYKESESFFKEGLTYEEFIEKWEKNEMNYIKRQLTWFKKDKRINWFDIGDRKYIQKVESLVKRWYSLNTNAKKN